jgi:hypothetical protein
MKKFITWFKMPFWKTYKVTFRESKGILYSVMFYRGFTWEVVGMATEAAKEKPDGQWAVWDIERIV